MEKNLNLTLEQAQEFYKNSNDPAFKQLLEANFGKSDLTKKEYPKTYKELKSISGFYITDNSDIDTTVDRDPVEYHCNIFKTKELAEACKALAQISQLYTKYREIEGDEQNKRRYIIFRVINSNGTVDITTGSSVENYYHFLTFYTKEARDLFFNNFKHLLEKAKILL